MYYFIIAGTFVLLSAHYAGRNLYHTNIILRILNCRKRARRGLYHTLVKPFVMSTGYAVGPGEISLSCGDDDISASRLKSTDDMSR